MNPSNSRQHDLLEYVGFPAQSLLSQNVIFDRIRVSKIHDPYLLLELFCLSFRNDLSLVRGDGLASLDVSESSTNKPNPA